MKAEAKSRPEPQEEWSEAAKELAAFLASLCAPPSSEPTETWAEKHVIVQDGPFAGSHWRLQFTLFIQWIFAAIRKPTTRRVVVMMSAQYLKTTLLIITFLRNVKEDPADSMWVMSEADHMTEFRDKRIVPYIEGCDVVRPLKVRAVKNLIQFDGMNLMLRGSNSRAKLQSDPVRYVYCDERREWKKGAIDLLRKRLRTFPNALEISAGTAGNENDELHLDYLEGSQTRAHIRCPKCGHSQPIRFGREATALWPSPRACGGFVGWSNETNPGIEDVTRPGGKWDYQVVRKNVWFECENADCKARFSNADKYDLLRTMHPHDYNPSAPTEVASFGGSAFEAIWESCDWDKLVVEFLKAVESARAGNIEPLKAFVTETLGEPWQDRLGVVKDYGFLETRKAPYDYGEVWPEAQRRFMAADKGEKGGEHYWWLIREFGPFGKSRLVSHGKARTLAELEETRKSYNVSAGDAIIDSGYTAQEIYRFCLGSKWKPFKGEDRNYYLVAQPHPKLPGKVITVRQIWHISKVPVYHAALKHRIANLNLFLFGDFSTQDLLTEYMTGRIGEWTIPAKVAAEYMEHVSNERREEKTDDKGRVSYFYRRLGEQGWRDCEKMILIGAIASKTINAPAPRSE